MTDDTMQKMIEAGARALAEQYGPRLANLDATGMFRGHAEAVIRAVLPIAGEHQDGGYRIEYDNDTGPSDEGFWEWWFVIHPNGGYVAKCDSADDAKIIVEALTLRARLAAIMGET